MEGGIVDKNLIGVRRDGVKQPEKKEYGRRFATILRRFGFSLVRRLKRGGKGELITFHSGHRRLPSHQELWKDANSSEQGAGSFRSPSRRCWSIPQTTEDRHHLETISILRNLAGGKLTSYV